MRIYSRLYKALFVLVALIFMGVIGYMWISDISFIDALYMTIITMSTVGFGEVVDLSPEARLFTVFLILMSVSIFGYTISVFTEILASGHLGQLLKTRKVQKEINGLRDHIIVCGYGRNGREAVGTLKNFERQLVVIEQDEKLIEELEEQKILVIDGDATTDEVLEKAGINNAKSLITALPSDADNLFVVLSARQLNKNCKIISRASKEGSYKKLKIAGADNVIMPNKLGGGHMAALVVTPDVVEFVDRLTIEGETNTNLKEIAVNDLPEQYIGKTILDLDLRRKTGCTAIGFKDDNNEYIINPDVTTVLKKNTYIIVLGRTNQVAKLQELF